MKPISHYIQAIKYRGYKLLNERRGWTTNRKIVVIESDDWGSIRMPSTNTLNNLLSRGVKLFPELGYDRLDTLASNDDLELLFDVLSSFKDKNDNYPKVTFNTIMVNPDFQKIKESDFLEYHYELFTNTLKRYPNHNRSFSLWQEGIKSQIIKPQFHSREHLNVQLWLKGLKENFHGTRESFNKEIFCNSFDQKFDKRRRYLETYNISSDSEYPFVIHSITEGLQLFEEIFGYKSTSMIAPNYIWDDIIEKTVHENGVKYIQGGFVQRNTDVQKNKTNISLKFHYLGEMNSRGQLYLTRNCLFEPSQDEKLNAEYCLNQVKKAFSINKPAIICTHRLNYIGGLEEKNRDYNLKQLSKILSEIIKTFPEVEFLSSDELGDIIQEIMSNNPINK